MLYSASNTTLILQLVCPKDRESMFIRLIPSNLHRSFSYLPYTKQQEKKTFPSAAIIKVIVFHIKTFCFIYYMD